HKRPLPHHGVDIAPPNGSPIYAAAKGRVTRSSWVVGYGLTVEIDHGYGYTTLYGHASKLLAQVGHEVRRGEVIEIGRASCRERMENTAGDGSTKKKHKKD